MARFYVPRGICISDEKKENADSFEKTSLNRLVWEWEEFDDRQ